MQTQQSVSRSWLWLAVAALVTGSASVVAAAGAHDRGGNGRHSGDLVSAFDRIDSNSDDVVTRAEFDANVAAQHAGLDADADGAVTFEEQKAFRQARREARARERFARLDNDGNGTVSTAEATARSGKMFDRLDRNDDGNVARDELTRRRNSG